MRISDWSSDVCSSDLEALAALGLARSAFPRISFDLIYARPGQGTRSWRDELAEALALQPEHISLYQLTIEEGTAFHGAWRRGELVLPEQEAAATLYEATALHLAEAGLPAYERSEEHTSALPSLMRISYAVF